MTQSRGITLAVLSLATLVGVDLFELFVHLLTLSVPEKEYSKEKKNILKIQTAQDRLNKELQSPQGSHSIVTDL